LATGAGFGAGVFAAAGREGEVFGFSGATTVEDAEDDFTGVTAATFASIGFTGFGAGAGMTATGRVVGLTIVAGLGRTGAVVKWSTGFGADAAAGFTGARAPVPLSK
jgi:hypothetical protein